MKIVLDGMGGDLAPGEITAGAVQALKKYPDVEIILTGQEELLLKELNKYEYPRERIRLIDAREVIGMNESPTRAIRKKKDSSIVKGIELVKKEEAGAFISAGSTGAVMAASLFNLGRLKGIKRPSITIDFPSLGGRTLVMDNGANTDSKPEHLLQFALMGQIYARNVMGVREPRLGLLSIGEEKEKGNQLVKESYQLLAEDRRLENFIGNVEGRDIFNGRCDVVICDGFVGNIVLKTTEGVASYMFKLLKEAFTSSLRAKLGALLIKPYLKDLKDKTDYRQYGGAPLLGVNGVVIISHGSSDATAICNAVKVARQNIKGEIVKLIDSEITE